MQAFEGVKTVFELRSFKIDKKTYYKLQIDVRPNEKNTLLREINFLDQPECEIDRVDHLTVNLVIFTQ